MAVSYSILIVKAQAVIISFAEGELPCGGATVPRAPEILPPPVSGRLPRRESVLRRGEGKGEVGMRGLPVAHPLHGEGPSPQDGELVVDRERLRGPGQGAGGNQVARPFLPRGEPGMQQEFPLGGAAEPEIVTGNPADAV